MKNDVARLKSGSASVLLRVVADPGVTGVVVSHAARGKLTAYYSYVAEQPLCETRAGKHVLTPPSENPFLSEEAKAVLDEQGLIRPETVVRTGTIMASIVSVGDSMIWGREPAPEGMERFTDDSLEAGASLDGYTATSVEIVKGQP